MVANADQLVIVVALADPPPRTGFIDRCLVGRVRRRHRAAAVPDQGRPGRPGAAGRRSTGRSTCRTSSPAADRDPRRRCASGCAGRTSVLLGHTGVGKSTLVNALVPGARPGDRRRQRRHRARPAHLDLGGDAAAARTASGWIVDTPGIRSFGLAHVDRRRPAHRLPRPAARPPRAARAAAPTGAPPECALDAGRRARSTPSRVRLVPPPAGKPRRRAVTLRIRLSPMPTSYTDDLRLAHVLADDADSLDHGPLPGARPARGHQARPHPGHRRRPRGRGGHPPHPVAGPAARRRPRRGARLHRLQPAALGGRPDRRHQELRPRRPGVGHPDRAHGGGRGRGRRGLGPDAAAGAGGRPRAAAPSPASRCSSRSPCRVSDVSKLARRLAVLLLARRLGASASSTTSWRCRDAAGAPGPTATSGAT